MDECGEHYMSTGLVRCAQVILANLALRKEIRVREAMKKAKTSIIFSTEEVIMLGRKQALVVISTGHYCLPLSRKLIVRQLLKS